MPRKTAPRLVNLVIEETSGVDHPAHLHEGWLVVKASPDSTKETNMGDTDKGMMGYGDDEEKMQDEKKMDGYGDGDAMGRMEVMGARLAELESRLAELEGKATTDDAMAEEQAMEDMEEAAKADDLVALAKSAPPALRKALAGLAKAKADAEVALVKERDLRLDEQAVTKARAAFSHLTLDPTRVGPALRRLALIDEELAKSVEEALTSADAQNESADIFREVGANATGATGDAYSRMTALAKAAVAAGTAKTLEQGIAEVALTNPTLYNEYLTEKGA